VSTGSGLGEVICDWIIVLLFLFCYAIYIKFKHMTLNHHQYTHLILRKRVLLVGVFPPPLGGISVHLKRVQAKLEQQGCEVQAWDICKQQQNRWQLSYYVILWRFCLKNRPQVIIYHTMQLRSYPIELLVLLLAGKLLSSQTIVMIHSARFIYRLSWLSRVLTGLILSYYDQLVLVSVAQQQEIGARINLVKLANKISVESPFLAPDLNDKSAILSKLPPALQAFLDQHKPVISCAVTRKDLWQGGDLYGLDLALAAFKLLQQNDPQAGLIVMISDKTGYEQLVNLPGVYLLFDFTQEVWPLIERSDLFIRPTRSDGNAISIMEALSLNVPVVASDVCVRPAGVVLFKSGDAHDLYLKMQQVLKQVAL
jgi:glycosyltransferase involved in cell wall biosynthesis